MRIFPELARNNVRGTLSQFFDSIPDVTLSASPAVKSARSGDPEMQRMMYLNP
jgi:hypothetical protein